eukprot:TRINITY_DN7713_c0_g1_i1.p1 TRINITY_DN7713_c0_g1~~TRINITY_DN7713_c0_g1_i1.p1  ORF type:complete len:198 (-),score=21.36 TRINITY_DN7713_c0_g1_i1:6-599(-)
MEGEIQLILGPMFSGKSTELLRRIRRFTIAKRKCLVLKHNKDIRYTAEALSTHDRQEFVAVPCDKLLPLVDNKITDEYSVIGIDEGQFFSDIVQFCEQMANEGKTVIVAALDGTFERKPFGQVLQLIPLAESVVKLNAVCMICLATASFSLRLTRDKEVVQIGGTESYIAVCRKCYHLESAKRLISNTQFVTQQKKE